jgi:hypothetical protein
MLAPSSRPPLVRRIDADGVEGFVRDVLFSPSRPRAVVAVTSNPREPLAGLDATRLAQDVGDVADVYALETGETTWALSAALPTRLDVFGGAVRVWWPGLTARSNPKDHPLFFCFARSDVEPTARRVIAAVRARARPEPPARRGVVTRVVGDRIDVEVAGVPGVLAEADVALRAFAADVAVGESLLVREMPGTRDANGGATPRRFTTRGILQDPWARIDRHYAVGDTVRARVCRVEDRYVLVEVLPDATLLVPAGEVDYGPYRRPAEIVRVGEVVSVRLLSLDPANRRASIRQGFQASDLQPPLSPSPGRPPYLPEGVALAASPVAEPAATDEERRSLLEEVRSLSTDRDDLVRRLREANDNVASLRKSLRSAEDRAAARAAEEPDPLATETGFLTAVRVEYARRFDEGTRAGYPLQRMRVGREFLARLRALEGIDVSKVVEVCAQVACSRAHEIPGRAVHELRAGERGADGRVRAADDAKAWRCSLQDGTPGARRLHWWEIPGPAGKTIEFASVAVHDDTSIPA